jgi:hypothetical protein
MVIVRVTNAVPIEMDCNLTTMSLLLNTFAVVFIIVGSVDNSENVLATFVCLLPLGNFNLRKYLVIFSFVWRPGQNKRIAHFLFLPWMSQKGD